MKLTIDRISLLRPLGQVQSVVERRNTIPILANVVLQAADGALLMTATDMDMDIATQVECAVGTAGTTTVSAHLLCGRRWPRHDQRRTLELPSSDIAGRGFPDDQCRRHA